TKARIPIPHYVNGGRMADEMAHLRFITEHDGLAVACKNASPDDVGLPLSPAGVSGMPVEGRSGDHRPVARRYDQKHKGECHKPDGPFEDAVHPVISLSVRHV